MMFKTLVQHHWEVANSGVKSFNGVHSHSQRYSEVQKSETTDKNVSILYFCKSTNYIISIKFQFSCTNVLHLKIVTQNVLNPNASSILNSFRH